MSEIKISFDGKTLVLKKTTKDLIAKFAFVFLLSSTGILLSDLSTLAIIFLCLVFVIGVVCFTKKDIIEINVQNSIIRKYSIILFIEFKYDYIYKLKGPLEIYSKEKGDEEKYISFFIMIKNKEISLFDCQNEESVNTLRRYLIDNEIIFNSQRINFIAKWSRQNLGLLG
ncbi:MAG: hypothetical protein J7604_07165 [Sporocytophaga sp.]|uniref:hypothetical protein n=1 Tax=Sporocytophaga sp. TaxID=2231183 RepID=UPI001B1B845E|nr:hypothetical protein [Sporocytophaga sp.]MBO9699973.1 hypothetical protein [Sporocytophaga sp.]